MKFALKDIEANPHRNIKTYPYDQETLAELRESVKSTKFWNNVVARQVGSKAQIAYGHHRLKVLREKYSPEYEVELIIAELSDRDMLMIMIRENMQRKQGAPFIEQENIRAVVRAFADGVVELPKISKAQQADYRNAPNFNKLRGQAARPDRPIGKYYSAETLSEITGYNISKIRRTLTALAYIEAGIIQQNIFEGLGARHAEVVVREGSKTEHRLLEQAKKYEEEGNGEMSGKFQLKATVDPGKVMVKVANALRDGTGIRDAWLITQETLREKRNDPPPDIDSFCMKVSKGLARFIGQIGGDWTDEIKELIRFKSDISDLQREKLIKALNDAAARANKYAEKLDAGNSANKVVDDQPQIGAKL